MTNEYARLNPPLPIVLSVVNSKRKLFDDDVIDVVGAMFPQSRFRIGDPWYGPSKTVKLLVSKVGMYVQVMASPVLRYGGGVFKFLDNYLKNYC